jgi:DNA ligase (NAD+)
MPHRIDQLRDLILKAKHAYYYSGQPIMPDAEYDSLEDELRRLSPDDPVLALVGSPVPPDTILTKARHAMPMGSQNKVNSEAEFRAWVEKSGGPPLQLSLKGDGASAAAYYREGRLVQAISRGDGTIGEDITANAMRFKGLPAWAGLGATAQNMAAADPVSPMGDLFDRTPEVGSTFTGAVRFEVILTIEDWSKVDPARSKNPRNAGSGIMGRKNGHQCDHLTAFAFDIDEQRNGQAVRFASESDKLTRLAELGFNVISHQCCGSTDEAVAWFREVAARRPSLPFWIDGIVAKIDDLARQESLGVTAGRPKGQVAWKFDSAGAETVLEDVIVSGGHTGSLVPTAQLRPVEIGGTTVSSASLANFDEIARLDVAVGDSVWLIKANDIIPKVIRVTERPAHRRPILAPTRCPFCGGEVGRRRTTAGDEGVILECRNGACPKKSSGKISRWISSLDIQGIGDSVLEAMLDRFGIEDAADLYALQDRAAELADLIINDEKGIRLGEKRAQSILGAIDATRTLQLAQFLGSLGIDHAGVRRIELMIEAAGGDLDTLEAWRSGRLRDPAMAERAGVPNLGGPIQDGIDAMAVVIDKMLANGVVIVPPQRDLPGEAGAGPARTVCISGKLPSGKKKSDYEAPLAAAGLKLVDSVTRETTYLVLADPQSASGKAEKARKLGIEVISEDALIEMVQPFL